MWELSAKAKDHVFNPKNAGVLTDADAVGEIGSIGSGDAFRLTLKIDPATEMVTAARFQAFGCGAAIAAASVVTEMVAGKTVEQARAITNADIAGFLDGLPEEKMYCAVLACEALQQALAGYCGEAPVRDDGEPICKCFGVHKTMIERVVRINKLTSPQQVVAFTKAGASCPTCFSQIEEMLAGLNGRMAEEGLIAPAQAYRVGSGDGRSPQRPRSNGGGMPKPAGFPVPGPASRNGTAKTETSALPQKIALIRRAIDELRPHLQRDGGDCEFINVEGNTVFVKLTGNCVGCQLASVTIAGVQDRLVEKLGIPLRIMPVQ